MADEIIIDLENLNSTKPLEDKEYIHCEKLNELTTLILETVKQNTKDETDARRRPSSDAWDDCPVHINQNPCFFIHGRRGSGKSVFLRGLRRKLIENNDDSCRIKLLANVDPTIFAASENFFIYILSRITKMLGGESRQNLFINDKDVTLIAEANRLLHRMSKGLQLLSRTDDSPGHSGNADFFFEDSIRNSASSDMLNRNFHELVSIICKMACVKALLLTIDDADLNFHKCCEILETTRKYMFSPHMIIVFAGDLSLYSHAIRGMHLNHFNIRNLDYDDTRKLHRDDLLDQLENQYITKFTPIEHRVELTGIDSDSLYNRGKSITLKYKDSEAHFIEFLRHYFRFIYPPEINFDIFNLLLDQPMRTTLQLMKHWIQYIPYQAPDKPQDPTLCYDYLAEGLGRAFSQTLIKHHINYTEVHKRHSNELLKEILVHIGKLGNSPGSTQLIPTVGDTTDKEITLFLNAEAVRYISSYYHFIYYMLFIYTMLQYMKNMPDFKYSADSENKFRNEVSTLYYTATDLDNNITCPWHTAFIIRAMERDSQKMFTHCPGIVRIMSSGDNERTSKILEYIESVKKLKAIKSKPLIHRFVYALYHCICVITTPHGTSYYFSIYSLLGIMSAYLYKMHRMNLSDDIIQFTEQIFQLRSPFSSLQMLDIYDYKHTVETFVNGKSLSELYAELGENLSEYNAPLHEEIIQWAKKYNTIKSPCYISAIDKAWNSFCTASELYYDNQVKDNSPVGIGSLFLTYINEFTQALTNDVDSQSEIKSEECISSFPLWKVLLNNKKKGGVIKRLINILDRIHVENVRNPNKNTAEDSNRAVAPENKDSNSPRLNARPTSESSDAPKHGEEDKAQH